MLPRKKQLTHLFVDAPAGLLTELFPHQRQALTWMLEREKNIPSTLYVATVVAVVIAVVIAT